MLPKARQDQLLVEEIAGELVVYDQARNRAHSLNSTAALVWRHCDGQTSVADLAGVVNRDLLLPADEQLVWLALDGLERAHLLHGRLVRPPEGARIARRRMIQKLGLASGLGLLLPVVTSIVAPTPAMAGSGPDECKTCGGASVGCNCVFGNCIRTGASPCINRVEKGTCVCVPDP